MKSNWERFEDFMNRRGIPFLDKLIFRGSLFCLGLVILHILLHVIALLVNPPVEYEGVMHFLKILWKGTEQP